MSTEQIPPPKTIRVFARGNFSLAVIDDDGKTTGHVNITAEHWGDVPHPGYSREVEKLLEKHLLLLEGPDGEPAPAKLPPRRCCGG